MEEEEQQNRMQDAVIINHNSSSLAMDLVYLVGMTESEKFVSLESFFPLWFLPIEFGSKTNYHLFYLLIHTESEQRSSSLAFHCPKKQ